jgi:hypothetical protein
MVPYHGVRVKPRSVALNGGGFAEVSHEPQSRMVKIMTAACDDRKSLQSSMVFGGVAAAKLCDEAALFLSATVGTGGCPSIAHDMHVRATALSKWSRLTAQWILNLDRWQRDSPISSCFRYSMLWMRGQNVT